MANRNTALAAAGILLFTSLACIMPVTVTIGQPTQAPAQPTAQPVEPTLPAQIAPAEAAPTVTATTNAQNLGAILVDPLDRKGLNLVAPDGSFLTELILGTDLDFNSTTTIPSSDYALPNETNRVMFYTYDGAALREYSQPGAINVLATVPNMVAMEGSPTCDAFSYGTVVMDASGTQNALYLAPASQLGKTAPVVSNKDARGYAAFPLAISCGEDQPTGLWYANEPYGIGGDIVFPPYSGLFYYDTAGGTTRLVLDENQRFSGISDDRSLVAYSHRDDPSTLLVLDVGKNSQTTIPALPDSNRGAGYAIFSPENTKLAWMEGSGFMMSDTPDFHATIRVGTPATQILMEKTDADFGAAAGEPTLWIKPVTWLDESNLLVEGRGNTWTNVYLLKLNTDTGSITLFAKGSFLGRYFSGE